MTNIKNRGLFSTLALLGALTGGGAAPTVITTTQLRGADLNTRGGDFVTGDHATNLLRIGNAVNRQDASEDTSRFDLWFAPQPAPDASPLLSIAFIGENPALTGTGALPAVPTTYFLPTAPVPDNAPAAKEINAFWEADKKQMPPQGVVLFMGSSSIRIWSTLAQDFAEIPVINRGFGGSFIHESTLYADRIALPYAPRMIVLAAGTNDLAYGHENPGQVFQDFKDFVAKIHGALPDTRIIYISINPTVARWNQESDILETNHLIERFIFENGKTQKLNFINSHAQLLTADGQPQPQLLQGDGLHFNPQGYHVWTSILKPRIMALATIDGVRRLDAPAAHR